MRLLTENWRLKLLAALLAASLYAYVQTEREVTKVLRPQIVLRLPDDLISVGEVPERARVVVSGPWAFVTTIEEEDIPPITIDLGESAPGPVTWFLDESSVRVPPGLRVASVTPAVVEIELDRVVTREVPVTPKLTGTPAPGFVAADPRVRPETVALSGAARELEPVTEVATETIDLTGVRETIVREVRLVVPWPHVARADTTPVQVTLPIREEITERTLRGIPVHLPEGIEATAEPEVVTIRVRGNRALVGALDAEAIRIHLPAERLPPPGERARVALDVRAPDGVEVLTAPAVEVARPAAVERPAGTGLAAPTLEAP
ncbi:MAG: hypothetical protein D6729_10240 [Deltaproteobacteria bacterium]|nr:MAG: hypothetical protein D6729_10240 [Deltaproteobacteria bacterium]